MRNDSASCQANTGRLKRQIFASPEGRTAPPLRKGGQGGSGGAVLRLSWREGLAKTVVPDCRPASTARSPRHATPPLLRGGEKKSRIRRSRALLTILCGLLLLAFTSTARGEPLSAKEFQEKLQGWKAEGKAPPPLTFEVEGRVTLYFQDHLRLFGMKDPPVLFVSNSELPDLNRKWALVTGKVHIDPKSDEYTFDVASAKEVPSDIEKFRDRRRKLFSTRPPAPAADWYEIGRWAEAHGQFYKDDELLKESAEAYRHGIDVDRRERAKDDPQGFFELAELAQSFRLPATVAQELTHEAFHLLVQHSANQPLPELVELAQRMAEKLPGALVPLEYSPLELAKQYQAQPVAAYAGAGPADRRKLHRLLYTGLLLRTIEPPPGSDKGSGFEFADKLEKVAKKIEELVPEQKDRLAEEYRDRALNARAADPEKLTKSQILDLVEQYRQRGTPRLGEQLLETWLTLRLRRLDPDDTEGLLEVTEEYRRLLKRNDLADRLLIDGWKRNPQARDLAERLERAGYRLFEGAWLPEDQFTSRPEGRLEKAIRAGLAEPGMTASQVRRSRGKPDSFSRAATSGQVTELWSYSLSDGSRLVVRFVKRPGVPEPTVAEVVQVKTP